MELLIKILAGFLVLIVLFVIVRHGDEKKRKQKLRNQIKAEWGIYTRDEYSDEIWKHIRYYAKKHNSQEDLDSITWNDLEMDRIYSILNHTRTSAGEEILYNMLHKPIADEAELKHRERIIQGFLEDEEHREQFEIELMNIGKTDFISVYEYLEKIQSIKTFSRWPHVMAAVLLSASFVSLFFVPAKAVFALFIVILLNAYFYYREKSKILQYVALMLFIRGMIKHAKSLGQISIPGADKEQEMLCSISGKFKTFMRFGFLVSAGSSVSGSLMDALMDYVRILFHVDLIKMSTMFKQVEKYKDELLSLYHIIGYLDSMLAVASYRSKLDGYCMPELTHVSRGEEIPEITAAGIYHPLIKKPVKNDFSLEKSMLLTGSNASGKSTFLKAVAINAIFAQTIHTVLADKYTSCYFRVYSSMALRDNLLMDESYFMVEIKSLKRIFDAVKENTLPVLCFIDEILRGTNTVERVAASSQLLKELSETFCRCFAATHDVELTSLLEEEFANYHFDEQLEDGDILFDYCLKKGRATSRNAIRLLELIGFGKETVGKSQKRAQYFLEQGVWKTEL